MWLFLLFFEKIYFVIDILTQYCYNITPFRYLKREYSAGSRRGS